MKRFLLFHVCIEARIKRNFKNFKAPGRKRSLPQPVHLRPLLPWRKVPATVIVRPHNRELNPKLQLCQILGDKPLHIVVTRAMKWEVGGEKILLTGKNKRSQMQVCGSTIKEQAMFSKLSSPNY